MTVQVMNPMFEKIQSMLNKGIQPVIRITDPNGLEASKDIGDLFFVDPGMKARVLSLTINKYDCVELKLNIGDYFEFNKKLEIPSYWDEKNGTYNLPYQVFYGKKPNEIEIHSFDREFTVNADPGIEVVEENNGISSLQERFLNSGADKPYVTWLEEQLLLAQGAVKEAMEWNWHDEETPPSDETLGMIAQAIGMSLEQLKDEMS